MKVEKKYELYTKPHVDCYKLLTEEDYKEFFYRSKCPKCERLRCQTTGRKVYCRKSVDVVEVKCDNCWELFWCPSPDWWC